MGEWTVPAAGLAILALLVLASYALPRYWPHSELVRMYFRPRFARQSGPYGVESRHDRVRRGLLVLAVAIALFVGGLLSFRLSELAAPLSGLRLTLEAYFFIAVLLAVALSVAAVGTLLLAPFLPPRTIRGEVRERADELASFLSTYAEGTVVEWGWPDFDAVRFAAPELEMIRADLARTYPRKRPPSLPMEAEQVRAFADRVRRATV